MFGNENVYFKIPFHKDSTKKIICPLIGSLSQSAEGNEHKKIDFVSFLI